MNNGCQNTDKEIWRQIPDDYYSPSIHVTKHGDVGISVGGHVIVASIKKWHEVGVKTFSLLKDKEYESKKS